MLCTTCHRHILDDAAIKNSLLSKVVVSWSSSYWPDAWEAGTTGMD